MIFESHAHYYDERFDEDREELFTRLKDENITKVVNVGASIDTSLRAVEQAKKYDFIYATVGVHPHDVQFMLEEDLETLIGLAAYEKVVAIGEIGLDYFYENSPKEVQKLWFREQLRIASEIDLPVIIHSRDAAKDTHDIIKENAWEGMTGVIHCFSGSKEMALEYIKMGFCIGVGGVVTYNNARTLVEVVEAIPLESIVVETDCPYLSPVPNRGKRNDSTNLRFIIDKIAEIKGIEPEVVEEVTYKNSMKLFLERQ